MNRTIINCLVVCMPFVAILGLSSQQAYGLFVANMDPSGNYTTPTDQTLTEFDNESGFVAAGDYDPGWANITKWGIYLGNGWVISAQHTFIDSQTSTDTIHGDSFSIVENSFIQMKNPDIVTSAGYSAMSDIKLYRLDSNSQFSGTAEQVALAAGRQIQDITVGITRPSTNQELLIMSQGTSRAGADSVWFRSRSTSGGNWSGPAICDGCLASDNPNLFAPSGQELALGYRANTSLTEVPAWGTNKVESPTVASNAFGSTYDPIQSGQHYVFEFGSRDTVAQAFEFDEIDFQLEEEQDGTWSPVSGGGNESRVAGGDSGGGVFSWNGSSWELNGVLHALGPMVSGGFAAAIRRDTGAGFDSKYGDLALFSEFAVYAEQINAYLAPPEGYETSAPGITDPFFSLLDREFGYDSNGDIELVSSGTWGDINLDGVISGDGTGSWETDDVTALREGWGWDINDEPGAQIEGIFAWKQGDLNQDGVTDWHDFFLLRDGFNSVGLQVSAAAVVGGSGGVPEPSTVVLIGITILGGLCLRRFSRKSE